MNLKQITLSLGVLASTVSFAQDTTKTDLVDNQKEFLTNSAQNILNQLEDQKFTIGGYAQIDYNQPLTSNGIRKTGKLDVHRFVTLLGYKFNDKTKFVTEIEYEHIKEVFLEQAFVDYKLKPAITFRAGLMLIPMGIINEYHEPTTYNGVERPNIDGVIIPTTWREMGAGFTGNIESASLKYQVYVVNGFASEVDGTGKLKGSNAFRGGRQKGAETVVSSPNFSAKVDYYGINGLKVGFSAYHGKTQSTAYDGLNINDATAVSSADSTVVGLTMTALDARYKSKGLQVRGQMVLGTISNTDEYNAKFSKDLGSSIYGGYLEVGYNVLQNCKETKNTLVPFVRYENYDTHNDTETGTTRDASYKKYEVVTGVGFQPAKNGVVYKADFQFQEDGTGTVNRTVNLGVGVWF